MKQAFFFVIALFVLFQLGEKVNAASIGASSENTESDQLALLENVVDRVFRIIERLVDSMDNNIELFQRKFDKLHQSVAGIIKANEPSDDAPEILKTAVKKFESFFNDGHAKLMALIDKYQKQGVQSIDSLKEIKENMKNEISTIKSNINLAKKISESSTA